MISNLCYLCFIISLVQSFTLLQGFPATSRANLLGITMHWIFIRPLHVHYSQGNPKNTCFASRFKIFTLPWISLLLYYCILSKYWMRPSRIWRILQVEEDVIHWGWRPRWIKPSKICRILHILQKPNSMIALLFIQIFSTLKLVNLLAAISPPGFLGQWFNNLQQAALLTSSAEYDTILPIANLVNSSWLWCQNYVMWL